MKGEGNMTPCVQCGRDNRNGSDLCEACSQLLEEDYYRQAEQAHYEELEREHYEELERQRQSDA